MSETTSRTGGFDDRWKIWIWENVKRGCEKDHIFKVLFERGFSFDEIRSELDHVPSRPLEEITAPTVSAGALSAEPEVERLERREIAPFVWEFDGVLSESECATLIESARGRLRPSTVVKDRNRRGADGEGRVDGRTSSNVSLDTSEDAEGDVLAIAHRLRRVIAELSGLPEDRQEPLQVVRYGPGERYDPHQDAFTAGSEYLNWECERGGQRVATFMVYLNDVPEGGETVFPSLDAAVSAQRGKAILWPNLTSDGRRYRGGLHASAPVERGEKWVLVCWLRESTFGVPLSHASISGFRGLDAWLPDTAQLDSPAWIPEETAKQVARIPYLGAGAADCRGFEKRPVDAELFDEISAAYRAVASQLTLEEGGAVGTYIGSVRPEVPACLFHEVAELNALVLDLLKPMHEAWCGFELEPASCYGFRVYLSGAFLHDHVDRPATHVISSTICVDRDLYAPWPLHARDADGNDHAVEIAPGELLLYESAHIVHGRPTPLNGRFYAALFAHYRPARDHDLWLESPTAWYRKHRAAMRPSEATR